MSEQRAPYQAGKQEHIRIERVSPGLWRIYSEYDNSEFIDCESEGMKALLDELLKIAGQFSDETPADWNSVAAQEYEDTRTYMEHHYTGGE